MNITYQQLWDRAATHVRDKNTKLVLRVQAYMNDELHMTYDLDVHSIVNATIGKDIYSKQYDLDYPKGCTVCRITLEGVARDMYDTKRAKMFNGELNDITILVFPLEDRAKPIIKCDSDHPERTYSISLIEMTIGEEVQKDIIDFLKKIEGYAEQ